MVTDPKSARAIAWTGFFALVVALAISVLRGHDDASGTLRAELAELQRRVDQLESSDPLDTGDRRSPAAEREPMRGGGPPATNRVVVPQDRDVESPGVAGEQAERAAMLARIKVLELKVVRLEASAEAKRRKTEGLAAPDSIPGALAVLLASRGVVTKIGDVEAIQANLSVLAELVADPTAREWDRIEAFRGMMMFGYAQPDLCVRAMPDVASIVLTSSDPKARRSAAAMLQNYRNPAIAATLMAAYGREPEAVVRAQIVTAMLKLRDDAGIAATLARAAKSEADPKLRARIRRVLQPKSP